MNNGSHIKKHDNIFLQIKSSYQMKQDYDNSIIDFNCRMANRNFANCFSFDKYREVILSRVGNSPPNMRCVPTSK